jgi:hypothetical protein
MRARHWSGQYCRTPDQATSKHRQKNGRHNGRRRQNKLIYAHSTYNLPAKDYHQMRKTNPLIALYSSFSSHSCGSRRLQSPDASTSPDCHLLDTSSAGWLVAYFFWRWLLPSGAPPSLRRRPFCYPSARPPAALPPMQQAEMLPGMGEIAGTRQPDPLGGWAHRSCAWRSSAEGKHEQATIWFSTRESTRLERASGDCQPGIHSRQHLCAYPAD